MHDIDVLHDPAAASSQPVQGITLRGGRPPVRSVALWFVIVAMAFAWFDHLGRSRTFFYDEWTFVIDRWRFEFDSFVAPHNGHLSIAPSSIFGLLFHTVGLDNYRAYRFTGLLFHSAVASAVAWYIWQRRGAVAGVAMGSGVLLLGAGWENIFWPFQIGFMGSTFGFIGALIALDRRTPLGNIVACILLIFGLGSSGVGIPAAGAVLVGLLLEARPSRRRWVGIVPICLYAGWYLAFGESEANHTNLTAVPRYVIESAGGAVAGLFATELAWGLLLLGALLALAASQTMARRSISPRLVTLLTMVTSFWILTGLSRAHMGEPAASRYVYVGSIVVVLILAETLPTTRPQLFATGAVVLSALSMWAGYDTMTRGAAYLRWAGQAMGAELAVMEQYRDTTDPDYRIDPVWGPMIPAGKYFAAVDGLGSSPAFPITAVASTPWFARLGADRVLLELAPIEFTILDVGNLPCVPSDEVEPEIEIVGGSTLVLHSGGAMEIRLRRFYDTPVDQPALTVDAGAVVALTLPRDEAPEPWVVVTTARDIVSSCQLSG